MQADEAGKYLEAVGKRGLEVLKIIHSLQPFMETYETDLGRSFMEEDIKHHSDLFNKIYAAMINTGSVEQRDVIMLQLLHGRLLSAHKKITLYNESLNKIAEKKL